ncbi:hypothetical protein PCE1_003371 [Barthelona sp. PCE]
MSGNAFNGHGFEDYILKDSVDQANTIEMFFSAIIDNVSNHFSYQSTEKDENTDIESPFQLSFDFRNTSISDVCLIYKNLVYCSLGEGRHSFSMFQALILHARKVLKIIRRIKVLNNLSSWNVLVGELTLLENILMAPDTKFDDLIIELPFVPVENKKADLKNVRCILSAEMTNNVLVKGVHLRILSDSSVGNLPEILLLSSTQFLDLIIDSKEIALRMVNKLNNITE